MAKRQVILVILDGWGIGQKNDSNPIHVQGTPNIDYVKANFSIGSLQASGISVGLPWGEEGNSEVGHLTIGAGKVLYQHFPRITISIKDGNFAKKEVFLNAFEHVKNNKSSLHLAGLLTEGNIHSSFEHLIALIKLAQDNGISSVILHVFSDGKDSKQKSLLELLKKLNSSAPNMIKIGSISGRYYSLDRDNHWDRIQKAYDVIVGNGPQEDNITKVAEDTYEKDLTDMHIEPRIINQKLCLHDNDALIFFNFREDRMRQIAAAFIKEDFSEFSIKKFSNLYIGTMTQYSDDFKVPVAYLPKKVTDPLVKVLADNNKIQLHIAETEKYNHVTYFFNGYTIKPFPKEYRVLIPSNNVVSHAEKPEMKAGEITSRLVQAIQEKAFDFIITNYANGDIVGHTGNYEATKQAVKIIDNAVGELTQATLKNDAIMIITSDHGNIEVVTDINTGEPTTTHDSSPVPIYIIGNEFTKANSKEEIRLSEQEAIGTLADIAPTILEIMDIPKPKEMAGQSLLKMLQ